MLQKAKKFLQQLDADDAGAMSVEKILILAVIAVPLLIVIVLFAKKAIEWFRTQEQSLEGNKL
jgi:Flp pilus assembly pilin Flp